MAITEKEKLEAIIEKYLELKEKNSDNIGYEIFEFMVQLYNGGKLPQVLSSNEYDELSTHELYRGVKDMNYHKNLLCAEKYFCGKSAYGNGIYTSVLPSEAARHTINFNSFNPIEDKSRVLKLKLMPSTRTIPTYWMSKPWDIILHKLGLQKVDNPEGYFDFIVGQIRNYEDTYGDYSLLENVQNLVENILSLDKDKQDLLIEILKCKNKEHFYHVELSINPQLGDKSKLAILLGYDGITVDDHVIAIFNREKIAVSEDEYERICGDPNLGK